MPITVAPMNTELKIIKVAISDEKLKKHMESLGFVVDAAITIISRNSSGYIVQLHQGRLAIDHDVSKQIYVSW